MLKIQGLTKYLGNKLVLDNCDLEIEEGSITGLIGINGAGKTTLLRCIAGIYEIDSGICCLGGEDIYENEEVKKHIQYLSDDLYFESDATITSIIEFYKIFYPEFDEVRFQGYIDKLKLDVKDPVRNFSKGMKKQTFICILLAMKPKLLLLDETFDGLDPIMKSIIKKAITDLVIDEKTTVIISSHSLVDIEKVADNYVVIDNHTISMHENIEASKENYHRIQMAFREEVTIDMFSHLDIVESDIHGQIATLTLKGDIELIEREIEALNPLMSKSIDLSLEDIFVSEMGQ